MHVSALAVVWSASRESHRGARETTGAQKKTTGVQEKTTRVQADRHAKACNLLPAQLKAESTLWTQYSRPSSLNRTLTKKSKRKNTQHKCKHMGKHPSKISQSWKQHKVNMHCARLSHMPENLHPCNHIPTMELFEVSITKDGRYPQLLRVNISTDKVVTRRRVNHGLQLTANPVRLWTL